VVAKSVALRLRVQQATALRHHFDEFLSLTLSLKSPSKCAQIQHHALCHKGRQYLPLKCRFIHHYQGPAFATAFAFFRRTLVGLVSRVGQVQLPFWGPPTNIAQCLRGFRPLFFVQPLAQQHIHIRLVELGSLFGQFPVGVVDQGRRPDHQRRLDHLLQQRRAIYARQQLRGALSCKVWVRL